MASKAKPIAIDLFAGAGGLSLGFRKAGFRIALAVECDPHAAITYRRNHPDTLLLVKDVIQLKPRHCLRAAKLRLGDVNVLMAGLPCQGFSESNKQTRSLSNRSNHLYRHFLRFVGSIRPDWVVIENVAGMSTLRKGLIVRRIENALVALGYRVSSKVLNAQDYGVAQIRRRLFIIGSREGHGSVFPSPSHGRGLRLHKTVRDAISDLPVLQNGAGVDVLRQQGRRAPLQGNLVTRNSAKVTNRYTHIRPGQNWKAIPKRLMRNYEQISRCHTGIYYRLRWDRPSKVLGNFRKNMLIHPAQHRGLSIREAARLQSFPDEFVFLGSIGFQQQQVANAVPPVLAEIVARGIRRASSFNRR